MNVYFLFLASDKSAVRLCAVYRVRQKNVYTLERKKTLRRIIDYCKSTIYFRRHNSMKLQAKPWFCDA